MIRARASLLKQVQDFFELRLRGLYGWQTVGPIDQIPPPNTIRLRPVEKHEKVRGRRQLDKEVVAVDFGGYALMVSSPEETPPIGEIVIFHPDLGEIRGPLDVTTWDRVEAFIKKGRTECPALTPITATRA